MPHRGTLLLLPVCAVLALGHQATAGDSQPNALRQTSSVTRSNKLEQAEAIRWLQHKAQRFQRMTWDWQRLTGQARTRPARNLTGAGIPDHLMAVRWWQHQAAKAWMRATHVPHKAQWLCIHRYEGSWPDAKNSKYFGGLQMDSYFEAAYGAWLVLKYGGHIAIDSSGHRYAVGGHAYLWTPLEQMWVAERAYKTRGFRPWPKTAHYCGLL